MCTSYTQCTVRLYQLHSQTLKPSFLRPPHTSPPFPPDTGTAYAYLATRRSADVFRVGESNTGADIDHCPFRFTWALLRER